MSVALIDVGSNTIRLSVYMIEGDGSSTKALSRPRASIAPARRCGIWAPSSTTFR